MSDYIDLLMAQLPIDEGKRPHPYDDATGKTFTTGMTLVGKLTVGVGRNMNDVAFSDDEIELMETNDIARAEVVARRLVPGFDALTDGRKAVIMNMAFNLGPGLSAFHNTLQAINDGRWADAAGGMRASRWFGQVGDRGERLAEAMRQG